MDEEDEHFLSVSHRKCILLSGTECHIINYLLTELARAVPGNIGARSVLSRSRANIPQYGPRARLVRGYYHNTILYPPAKSIINAIKNNKNSNHHDHQSHTDSNTHMFRFLFSPCSKLRRCKLFWGHSNESVHSDFSGQHMTKENLK